MFIRTGRRLAFRPTSWCPSRRRPRWFRRARRARTTSRGCAATSWRRRVRACMRSCTSPTSASPASRCRSFSTSATPTFRPLGENADVVIGVKVRMSENVIDKHGLEPLKRAIAACEMAGTGGKVMCHIGGVQTRALMSEILDTLRAGDILTHSYSGAPNNAGDGTNIVQDGKLLPAALAAKKRGVVFDVGHGGGSFDYTVAEAAIAQGAPPDTISSDIHVVSGNTPGMPFL